MLIREEEVNRKKKKKKRRKKKRKNKKSVIYLPHRDKLAWGVREWRRKALVCVYAGLGLKEFEVLVKITMLIREEEVNRKKKKKKRRKKKRKNKKSVIYLPHRDKLAWRMREWKWKALACVYAGLG
ncbi:hypothetical protein QE152_g27304 [Popillia japonica]|uniref:Uncharacterized protein n=1 Tax=Popillia japonica TaxID=7064 RepID=A0AAW1JVR8_POPJA